ncbi:MAG: PAS domain S-box protein [Anaerolineales bacterium]|nr:PAS domain S-box protein [Anaerolineales bacterium]
MPRSKTKAELQSELDEVKKKAAELEKVIESLDVSLCRWLPDTTLTHANQKYKGIFGIAGQAEGKQWLDFLPEESRASTAAFYDEVKKNPHVVTYEHPVTIEDGSIRHYQWFDTPLLDANGTVTEFQSIGIDITERKLSENELIAKEKKLKSLIDSQSHFVIRVNMAGKYSYWNSRFEKEFGWMFEPQGIQNSDVMTAVCEYHHQRVRKVVEQCVAQPGAVFSVEVDKPARDGGVRTTLWEFVCLTDDQNQPVEVQCMGIELTERKQSERLIAAQRDLARLAALGKPEEEIWAACFQAAAAVSELDCGGLYLFNKNTRAFELVYHTGLGEEFVTTVVSFAEDTPTAQLVLNGHNTYLNETDLKARSYNDAEGLRAAAIIPIHHRGQVLGCLNISSHVRVVVSEQARHALETIVAEIGNLLMYQQTEAELTTSNIQLRQTLVAARMGAWRYDVLDKRMHWSLEAAQLLGAEDQEEDAEKMLQYFYPDDREEILKVIRTALTEKGNWSFEYRILNAAGSVMWVTSFGKVECDKDGKPIAISGLMQDITERKLAELNLRESEKRLRAMLEVSQAMSSFQEMDAVLQTIVESATNVLQLESSAIYTLEGDKLYLEATVPSLPVELPDELRYADLMDHPHIKSAVSSKTAIVLQDAEAAELTNAENIIVKSRGLRSILYIPIVISEMVIGVLIVASVHALRAFSREEVALLSGFSGQVAQTMQNIRLYRAQREYILELEKQINERKQAEEDLRESESKYRDLINGMNDTVWVIDADTRFLDVNEAAVNSLGYSREELLSMKISDMDPSLKPETIQQLVDRMRLEKRQIFETHHRKKDGSEIPVEISSSLISYQGRTVVMSIARDITERKQAEEALNKSQALLKEAQRIGRIGYMEWSGRDQTLLCSDEMYDIFEVPRGTPISQDLISEKMLPGERERLQQLDLLAMQQRADLDYEYNIRADNGDIRWLRQVGKMSYDENGVPIRMMAVVQDITDRKRTESILRENEERLRTVADFTYDMEFWVNEDRTLQYMSPSCKRITGYDRDQFLNDPSLLQFIVHPDDRQVFEQHSAVKFSLPDSSSLEFRIITAEGAVRWISHTCQPVTAENGEFHGRRVNHRDVTERRRVLEELRASEEKYRGLVKSLTNAISVIDINGNFLYTNDTAASDFDSTPQQVIGRNMRDLFPEPFASSQMSYVQRVCEIDQEVVYEAQSMVKKGLRWFRVSFQPLHDDNGMVNQVLVSATDIHDLKVAQQELQELNRTLEEKVTQRTAEVQDLYENAPTGYHSINAEGKFVMVNQTELNWLGYTREEMIGHPIVEFISEKTRTAFYENFPLFEKLGWVKDVEFELVRKDGSLLPVLLSATAQYDATGRFLMSRSTIFDITERKQADNELKRNVNFTNALLNAIPTPVFYKDKEGRYLGCNSTFSEFMGKTEEEIKGKFPHELWEISQADMYRRKDMELMQGKERQVYEATVMDKNGAVRPVIFVKDIFYDESSNVAGLVGAFIDITERKQIELALRESEATYRALFENSNDGIFLMGATGEELRANQRALDMLGYTLEEYLSLGHINQNPFTKEAEQRKDSDDKLGALLRGEHVPLYERIFTAKDGRKVPVEINLSPVRDANGKIIMVQSVVRGIAERKAAEEALRLSRDQLRTANTALQKASQAKNEFLANMSHELRTPLNGILGMAEILLEEIRGSLNERQRKMVEVIETSGQHLLSLINDILDLSKIEAGKLELNLEEIYVADICQTSLSFIKEPAMKKDIRVALELDPQVATIHADMRRMKQILINLLSNAVKFTLPKGDITLRVENDAERELTHFSVVDTGIGISDEDMKKLFTPFTQVDSSLTREYEGTGLGLALVMELAELHGGSVKVESTVGHGSTFMVTIPWNTDPEYRSMFIGDSDMQQQSHNQNREENSSDPKFTVLLAEDMETNIMVMGDYLEDKGYKVIKAANGREAIERADLTPPDLILMDIQMPVMDGLEAIRRLRTDPRFTSVPIVALTALAMTGDRERCLEAGATEYISKPVKLKQLAEMIQILLASHTQ